MKKKRTSSNELRVKLPEEVVVILDMKCAVENKKRSEIMQDCLHEYLKTCPINKELLIQQCKEHTSHLKEINKTLLDLLNEFKDDINTYDLDKAMWEIKFLNDERINDSKKIRRLLSIFK